MHWVGFLQCVDLVTYKLSSGYAAHLSPWKGEMERGLPMPSWHKECIELFFAVCWLGYFICFWVVIQHTSPLVKGRKRGDYLCRTVIRNALSYFFCSVLSWLLYMLLSSYAAHFSPCNGEKARGLPMPNWDKECIELAFAVCWVGYFISFCVVMQHTSPLGKGRWRGDCWYQTLCTIYI